MITKLKNWKGRSLCLLTVKGGFYMQMGLLGPMRVDDMLTNGSDKILNKINK